jgi:hypothetical protein
MFLQWLKDRFFHEKNGPKLRLASGYDVHSSPWKDPPFLIMAMLNMGISNNGYVLIMAMLIMAMLNM